MCLSDLLATVLLGLSRCCLPAAAHLPAVYGRDYVSVDDARLLPRPCPAMAPAAPAPGNYDRHIRELERDAGPCAAALAEPLAQWARQLHLQGDHQGALEQYQRSLHLLRVNGGLATGRQLALLDEIAGVHLQRGDFAAYDHVSEQKYRVQGTLYPAGSEAQLEAALDYLAWQRQALAMGLPGSGNGRLLA